MLFRSPSVLAAMTVDLDLPRGQAPFDPIPGLLWEIGDVRIGKRSARDPIWFARRLWDPAVQRKITEIARDRPHTRQRIILTSSGRDRMGDFAIGRTIIVPLHDVLARPDGLAVSVPILDARLGGVQATPDGAPLALSPDGRALVIRGGEPVRFRTAMQITVIRRLVEGYELGIRYRATDLLDLAGSNAGSLRRLFGSDKWMRLAPDLKSSAGHWGFEL